MIYEFVNPHDKYSFEAPDDEIADAMCVLIGSMYGWRNEEKSNLPGFMVSPEERTALVELVERVMQNRSHALRYALVSLEIEPERRKRLGCDPEAWHEEMRTSMADPRKRALAIADQLATHYPKAVE